MKTKTKVSVPLSYPSQQKFLIKNKATSGLRNNLFKIVSVVELTTTSAFPLSFTNVLSALKVNFAEVVKLLLQTASANRRLTTQGTA